MINPRIVQGRFHGGGAGCPGVVAGHSAGGIYRVRAVSVRGRGRVGGS